jgi:hypothetical protein
MKPTSKEIALLIPVPLEHLIYGLAVCKQQGKVSFGSRAWEIFRKLDQLRNGEPVDVYLYATHTPGRPSFKASWHGIYLRHVEGIHGNLPEGMIFCPSSTAKYGNDNSCHWTIFWEVARLRELAPQKHIPMSRFIGWDKYWFYKTNFIPEGPMLVHHPCPLKRLSTLPAA